MTTKLYQMGNWGMVTTAPPSKIATGTSTITLLQIKTGTTTPIRIKEWGISFDGFAAASPGICELLTTGTVAATVTAATSTGIVALNDPNAPASTVALSTTGTGYTATSEGSITTTRSLDTQLIAPSGQYIKQWPLGDEPEIAYNGQILRVRVTTPATVNALCYVTWEE